MCGATARSDVAAYSSDEIINHLYGNNVEWPSTIRSQPAIEGIVLIVFRNPVLASLSAPAPEYALPLIVPAIAYDSRREPQKATQ